jgi:predicted  nucleic acid-binding Zn-ribbon protein
MGHNLISGCHKCKVKIFHFRREENKTALPFYKKHSDCAKEDINNVQTVMDNNGTDQWWAESDGYADDELQE